MRAKVTLTFNDDAIDAFAEMFNIEDYSKLPIVLEAVIRAALKAEDNCEQLDSLTVEMVE